MPYSIRIVLIIRSSHCCRHMFSPSFKFMPNEGASFFWNRFNFLDDRFTTFQRRLISMRIHSWTFRLTLIHIWHDKFSIQFSRYSCQGRCLCKRPMSEGWRGLCRVARSYWWYDSKGGTSLSMGFLKSRLTAIPHRCWIRDRISILSGTCDCNVPSRVLAWSLRVLDRTSLYPVEMVLDSIIGSTGKELSYRYPLVSKFLMTLLKRFLFVFSPRYPIDRWIQMVEPSFPALLFDRPSNCFAISYDLLVPSCCTSEQSVLSSSAVHGPFFRSGCSTFCHRWRHWISVR